MDKLDEKAFKIKGIRNFPLLIPPLAILGFFIFLAFWPSQPKLDGERGLYPEKAVAGEIIPFIRISHIIKESPDYFIVLIPGISFFNRGDRADELSGFLKRNALQSRHPEKGGYISCEIGGKKADICAFWPIIGKGESEENKILARTLLGEKDDLSENRFEDNRFSAQIFSQIKSMNLSQRAQAFLLVKPSKKPSPNSLLEINIKAPRARIISGFEIFKVLEYSGTNQVNSQDYQLEILSAQPMSMAIYGHYFDENKVFARVVALDSFGNQANWQGFIDLAAYEIDKLKDPFNENNRFDDYDDFENFNNSHIYHNLESPELEADFAENVEKSWFGADFAQQREGADLIAHQGFGPYCQGVEPFILKKIPFSGGSSEIVIILPQEKIWLLGLKNPPFPYLPGGPIIRESSTLWGEPHCHTNFSDAYCDISPQEAVEYGRLVSCLDFVAITDHAESIWGSGLCHVEDGEAKIIQLAKKYNEGEGAEGAEGGEGAAKLVPESGLGGGGVMGGAGLGGENCANNSFFGPKITLLPGYEWTCGNPTDGPGLGHLTVLFPDYSMKILPFGDDYPDPHRLSRGLANTQAIAAPHHLGVDFVKWHWEYWVPNFTVATEIASSHGFCDFDYKGNTFQALGPKIAPNAPAQDPTAPGPKIAPSPNFIPDTQAQDSKSAQDISKCAADGLALGIKMAFIGGSDSHWGRPGTRKSPAYHRGIPLNAGAITWVNCDKNTGKNIIEAIKMGHCGATTGPRMVMNIEKVKEEDGKVYLKATSINPAPIKEANIYRITPDSAQKTPLPLTHNGFQAKGKVLVKVPEKVPEIMFEKEPEKVPEIMFEKVPEKVPEIMFEKEPENVSEKVPEKQNLQEALYNEKASEGDRAFYFLKVQQIDGEFGWTSPLGPL